MYDFLSQWDWEFHDKYALRQFYVGKKHVTLYMHQVVLPPRKGFVVDHINGEKLDNRRENLRYANLGQNQHNRRKLCTNTSGFKGVHWHKGKWEAAIVKDNKKVYLGRFISKELAALAYNEAAKELHGEFARLNDI